MKQSLSSSVAPSGSSLSPRLLVSYPARADSPSERKKVFTFMKLIPKYQTGKDILPIDWRPRYELDSKYNLGSKSYDKKQGKYRFSRNYLNPGYKNNINPSVARKEASATKSDGCRYQLSFIGATLASVVPVTNNVRVSSILLVDERHTLADSLLIERNQFMMALRQRLLQAFYHTFQCNHRAHLQERAEHNHIVRF